MSQRDGNTDCALLSEVTVTTAHLELERPAGVPTPSLPGFSRITVLQVTSVKPSLGNAAVGSSAKTKQGHGRARGLKVKGPGVKGVVFL